MVFPKTISRLTGRTMPVVRTRREKAELVKRVRRIRGQIKAIETALEAEQKCAAVLQLAAAAKGALDSFMAEVLEAYVCPHMLDKKERRSSGRTRARKDLMKLIRSYAEAAGGDLTRAPRTNQRVYH